MLRKLSLASKEQSTNECVSFFGHEFVVHRKPRQLVYVSKHCADLSAEEVVDFAKVNGRARVADNEPKLGRGRTKTIDCAGYGRIVCRPLRRGGLVRYFVSQSFVTNPFSPLQYLRPVEEIRILSKLSAAGISVPVPAAACVWLLPGRFIYRGAVLTKEIAGAKNVLEIAAEKASDEIGRRALQQLCYHAGKIARQMIECSVMHEDLHLGNVLFVPGGQVYLIDFDKAHEFTTNKEKVQCVGRLRMRWRQSALKHQLFPLAVEPFERGLAERYERGEKQQ